MSGRASRVAYYGLLTAAALLMGWVEYMIPIPLPLPAVKLGLANIVVLILIYRDGVKCAAVVNLIRILLCAMLFGGVGSLLYSLAGGILSTAAMALLYRAKRLGVAGVSVVGAVMHNIGQLSAACLAVGTLAPLYYLPYLTIAAVICGFATGILAGLLIKRLPPVDKRCAG